MSTITFSTVLTIVCFVVNAELVSRKQQAETCAASATGHGSDCKASTNHMDDLEVDKQTTKLVQLDGVKVGYRQKLHLVEGQVHHLVTRSLKPLLFEVPNFLTTDECEHIIQAAQEKTLTKSGVLPKKTTDEDRQADEKEHHSMCNKLIHDYDDDSDGMTSISEFSKLIQSDLEMPLNDKDAAQLFHDFMWDTNNDGLLTKAECFNASLPVIEEVLSKLEESDPIYRSRYSDQVWLDVNNIIDPILKRLQLRLMRLTQLPLDLLQSSEPLQVVRYSVRGHFHAHYDSSEDKALPCCYSGSIGVPAEGTCHLCRYMTVLYYLNDVTSGGETAFPVADNATFDNEVYDKLQLDNLSLRCNQSNLVVKPRRGTAILWYNHRLDRQTGHMGPMDIYSLHGGCDVIKGVKWIANNWINVPHLSRD